MKTRRHIIVMSRTRKVALLVILCVALCWYFILPDMLFVKPYSSVLYARNGQLLGASIAVDGQWRFPLNDTVPEKFKRALTAFEDGRFHHHPGVDVLALGRAMVQNVRAGRIVSGGSTLTMQVIRLSRGGKPRTIGEKLMEMAMATRLEWQHSKEEILSLYASHAPFGGNVVGLEAACWRYFGRPPQQLSWAEAAMLAVLPNAPALIHPGKNRQVLKRKRDHLLDRLHVTGAMDSLTCALSKEEMIPEEPQPLPRMARHLLARMQVEGMAGTRLRSTIDYHLQQRVEQSLRDHHGRLKANQVFNAAVLVLDVKTGKALAYAGNVDPGLRSHGEGRYR